METVGQAAELIMLSRSRGWPVAVDLVLLACGPLAIWHIAVRSRAWLAPVVLALVAFFARDLWAAIEFEQARCSLHALFGELYGAMAEISGRAIATPTLHALSTSTESRDILMSLCHLLAVGVTALSWSIERFTMQRHFGADSVKGRTCDHS
jgi:hypothetical protein